MEQYSARNLLTVLRELHRQGYTGLRFYTYIRWTGTLAIIIYRELPVTALSGEAFYITVASFEVKDTLSFKHPDKRSHGWGRGGITGEEASKAFSTVFLSHMEADRGAFDHEYFSWLDSAIKSCPIGLLPITEEPNDALQQKGNRCSLYPTSLFQAEQCLIYVPPGLAGAIDPYAEYSIEIERREHKTRDERTRERFRQLSLIERRIRGN